MEGMKVQSMLVRAARACHSRPRHDERVSSRARGSYSQSRLVIPWSGLRPPVRLFFDRVLRKHIRDRHDVAPMIKVTPHERHPGEGQVASRAHKWWTNTGSKRCKSVLDLTDGTLRAGEPPFFGEKHMLTLESTA